MMERQGYSHWGGMRRRGPWPLAPLPLTTISTMTIKTLFEQQKYKSSSYYIKLFLNKNKNRGKIYNTNNKTKLKRIISFKYQGYCFLRVSRNYADQKFHNFYLVCYKFWTIYGSFSFFLTT